MAQPKFVIGASERFLIKWNPLNLEEIKLEQNFRQSSSVVEAKENSRIAARSKEKAFLLLRRTVDA